MQCAVQGEASQCHDHDDDDDDEDEDHIIMMMLVMIDETVLLVVSP